MSETDYSKYDQLLEQARGSAKYWIPKLCEGLKKENSEMSNDDIRERVTQDCLPIWQKSTIRDALPAEYKQKEKAQAGKKGRQKQLEQVGGTVTITEEPEVPVKLRAENGSDSPTGQRLQTSDRHGPDDIVSQPNGQLNNAKQELQESKKGIAVFQERQNIEDIPRLSSEGVGLVKADKVIRISGIDKRDCAAYVHRCGEVIKRKIEFDGEVSIKFFILAKRKQLLVPVNFWVDFNQMNTLLVLDESRI